MLKLSDPNFKKDLPKKSGIYIFYNKEKKPLYVGKALLLNKRVSSYFSSKDHSLKTKSLVSKIFYIDYVVTKNETDSFLLENNFIKNLKPKYNILLRDDKSFPWILIKKEKYPRIFITRNENKNEGKFFGPFLSYKKANELLNIIKKLYPTISCSYVLNKRKNNKNNICLSCQINKCLGPCSGLQTEEDYNKNIDSIINFLKGNFKPVVKEFVKEMKKFSLNLDFELAQKEKEKIDLLNDYKENSVIVNNSFSNHDVFCIVTNKDYYFFSFVRITNGLVSVYKKTYAKKILNEGEDYSLSIFINNIYSSFKKESNSILSNVKIKNYNCIVPLKGYKKELINFSLNNLNLYKNRFEIKNNKVKNYDIILSDLKKELNLNYKPIHIESFDNSNLFGKNATSACVVFKNGIPSKKDYIHFNIKTVKNINDFDSMYEVVKRRYLFLKNNSLLFPNLILIDGGKGQLSSAYKALTELNLDTKIDLISIAKKEEIIFKMDNKKGYKLSRFSEGLKIIQQLRDEAHRFSLKLHRNKRLKSFISSELDNIPGIGEKNKKVLLNKFNSVINIKKQSLNNLIKIIGKDKAKRVYNYFNK